MYEFFIYAKEEWLTFVSIFLSGLISLLASHIYYYKGNRNSLQMVVMFPINNLLHEPSSNENYDKLYSLSSHYLTKYLKKNEKRVLSNLLQSYEKVSNYDKSSIIANIFELYFEDTLKKNSVNVEIFDTDYNLRRSLFDTLKKEWDKYPYEAEYEEKLMCIYNFYLKKYFNNEKVTFFQSENLEDIMNNSRKKKEWDKKFENLNKSKTAFYKLNILKEFTDKKITVKVLEHS